MKKNYFNLFCFAICTFCSLHGQILHHQSFSSHGNNKIFSNGFIINQSIGQSNFLGSYTNGSIVIQQGFQQTYLQTTSTQPKSNTTKVVVYPNPIIDLVNFQFSTELKENVDVVFYDMQGRTVLHSNFLVNGTLLTIANINYLTSGYYYISLKSNTIKHESILIKQ